MLVLLKGQSLSLFPLIKFPFLTWLPSSLSFIFTCLTLWCRNSEIHPTGWASLTSPPPVVPPLDLVEKLRWAPGRDSPLALLDWHPPIVADIHTSPPFTHWLQGWVKSHSLGSSLSLPHFQVLAPGGRIPTALRTLALCPVWLWNRGCPFQSRLLLLSEEVLRMGTPFLSDLSPHFLSPWSNFPIQPQWEILNPSPENLLL